MYRPGDFAGHRRIGCDDRVTAAFCQFEDAVDGGSVEELRLSIGPANLEILEARCCTETEVQSQIVA